MDKREFLRTLGGSTLGVMLSPALLARFEQTPADLLAQDDQTWTLLRTGYGLPGFIQLESGYFSMMSNRVLEAYIRHIRDKNRDASFYFRSTAFERDQVRVRRSLAELAGCTPEELIVTRNTTESLDTVISGQNWAEGDEAVMASSDYQAMLHQFDLMEKRYRIKKTIVSLPLNPASDDEIVDLYAGAITPRTKLLMVCHVVNITGQVLPVKKIAEMARARNVAVMVDGAHAFAQLQYSIADLNVDYYGASLHKWLGAPLGAGILYVRKERIADLWPLYGENNFPNDDIRKLNHRGTHPVATDLAIEDAISAYRLIGLDKKEARLRWLQKYWTDQVRSTPRISLLTPAAPERTCAIATVSVEGYTPTELKDQLYNNHRIFTVAIEREEAGVRGVRVTPHLYTTQQELDKLVEALKALAA